MRVSTAFPHRHVPAVWVAILLVAPPTIGLALGANNWVGLALALAWSIVSLPVAILSLTEWAHKPAENPTRGLRLLRSLARVPAALLGLVGIIVGVWMSVGAIPRIIERPWLSSALFVVFPAGIAIMGIQLVSTAFLGAPSGRPARHRQA
jgi:hypothetical protein